MNISLNPIYSTHGKSAPLHEDQWTGVNQMGTTRFLGTLLGQSTEHEKS